VTGLPDRLLTIAEVADATGESPRTIERWIAKGAIAVERVGPFGRIRIRVSTLRALFPPDSLRISTHPYASS
jgi:excisionase family DNA binding protein